MAAAFVQSWAAGDRSTLPALPITGAAVGNLLVAQYTSWDPTLPPVPAGWNLLFSDNTNAIDFSSASWWKIADGSDDISITTLNDNWRIVCCEYSGLSSLSVEVLENSAVNLSEMSGAVTAINTGSATPATADGLAVGFFSPRSSSDFDSQNLVFMTVDNGFTIDGVIEGGSSSRPASAIASLAYNSISAKTTTFQGNNDVPPVGTQVFASIAVFKEPGGASPTPPTNVDGGGPYSGTVGTPIAIDGASYTPGTGSPDVILWTNTGSGTWSDNSILSPTFTPDDEGNYTLTLTVTNDTGNGADTASLTATAATLNEMYIKDGGVFKQATPYIKEGGVFVAADAYVRSGGAWVKVQDK